MMQSPPTRSTIVSDETVYKAVKDFELLMMSGLEATHVIAGNQNNLSLPDSRDYVVNTIIAHREIGTPVEAYEWDTATQKMDAVVSRLVEMSVQVDVYSEPVCAQNRSRRWPERCQAATSFRSTAYPVSTLMTFAIQPWW